MPDEKLLATLARELADVALSSESARAAAREMAAMLEAWRGQRDRLGFGDAPRGFERLLRSKERSGG